MRKLFLILFLLVNSLQAQNTTELWFFGRHAAGVTSAGVNFNGGTPVQINGITSTGFYESITVQSDGPNLLFYSNSHTIWNRNHAIMLNGAGLTGSAGGGGTLASGVQGVVSFPFPGSTSRFALVTTVAADGLDRTLGIRWTEIDMTLDGGLGGVTANKDVQISPAGDQTTEMLGVHPVSCDQFWVVGHQGGGSNNFIVFEFTPSGPSAPVKYALGPTITDEGGHRGSLKISPDGTKLVMASGSTGGVYMFDFNSSTGAITNSVNIGVLAGGFGNGYGIEWSPNSRYAFFGGYTGVNGIRVFDTQTSTWTTIDNTVQFGDLQMAPNGVIYITPQALGGTHLATLTNPDLGPTATFNATAYEIGGDGGWLGLPATYSCPVSPCNDTTIANVIPAICVNDTLNLVPFQTTADPGIWTISAVPAGGNPAVINGDTVFDTRTLRDVGIYTLRFTLNDPGGAGCPAFAERTIEVYGLPNIDLGNDTSICADTSLILDAGAGFVDYNWSTGAISQTITVNTTNEYRVAVTDGNGCIGRDTFELSVNAVPVVTLRNDTAICADTTLILDAGAGFADYNWSTGDNTQTIAVNTANEYSVAVTDANGCIGRDTFELSVNAVPVVTLRNDTSICADTTLILDAGAGFADYNWSTGDNTQTIAVNTANEYSVTVTDGNGCIGRDTFELSVNAVPVATLRNDTSICADTTLILDAGAGFTDYNWSTGDNTQTIAINTANEYSVAVTDANGCIGRDTFELTIDTIPVINLSNDTSICADANLTIHAGNGFNSYTWNTGDNSSSITVNSADTFIVVVSNGDGCVGTDSIVISLDTLPIINLGNDTSICADTSIIFDATNLFVDYLWNTGATTDTIIAHTAGEYFVRVIDGNGCIGRDTIQLSIDTLPIINLGNDTSICIGDSLTLSERNIFVNYQWLPNGANQNTLIISQAGTYSLSVTDANGCIGRDTMELSLNPLPTPILLADTNICSGDSVLIGVQDFYINYTWRTGETSDSIVVNSANTYLVTVTDSNFCVNSDSVTITVLALPIVELGTDTAICVESDYALDAGNEGIDYLWNTGATTQNFTTQGASIYWVRVINADGCTTVDSITIGNHASPAVQLNIPDTSICRNDSIILDGGIWNNYLWNVNNDTTQTFTVFTAGTYILQVWNEFNCTAWDTTVVNIFELPNANLGGNREVCDYLSVTLTVPEVNANYLWSTGDSTQSISTNQSGEYWVRVQDANLCIQTDTINLIPGPDVFVDLGPNTTICPGQTHVVFVDPSDSIAWSTGVTNTTQITINSTQRIYVLVVDQEGCWGTDTVDITSVPNPTVTLRSDTSICQLENESIDLEVGNTSLDVLWNTGSTEQSIRVNTPGTYFVFVTDENNCTASDTLEITPYCRPIDITMPNVFTPNNDGYNDFFNPLEVLFEDRDYMMLNIESIEFEIFNRWGQVVHTSRGVLPNWNGLNDMGISLSSATYFWVLNYELLDGNKHKKRGYVQLVGNN